MSEQLRGFSEEIVQQSHVVEVITEQDPGNIFSDPSRDIPLLPKTAAESTSFSQEGFADNGEMQKSLAHYINTRLAIASRGAFLDVGIGQNQYVSQEFARLGVDAYAIDPRRDPRWFDHAQMGDMGFNVQSFFGSPKQINHIPMRYSDKHYEYDIEGVRVFAGDVELLDEEDSELREQQFGLILFNGSWSSGGFNYTVAESQNILSNQERDQRQQFGETYYKDFSQPVREKFIQNHLGEFRTSAERKRRTKEKILTVCANHLEENGLLGVVSSRYAYRGGGYWFEELPREKLEFLDLFVRLTDMGARKVYLFGYSQSGFDTAIEQSYQKATEQDGLPPKEDIERTRNMLRSTEILTDEKSGISTDSEFSIAEEEAQRIISVTRDRPEINQLARIDALFAEF